MRRSLRYIALCVCFLLLNVVFSSSSGHAAILIGPYPQDAQFTSITISWTTTNTTLHNEVHWGGSQQLGNVTPEHCIWGKKHHVVTISNLTKGQKYYYLVSSDSTQSPLYSFYTAVPLDDSIRCVVYGDTQGEWDKWQSVVLVAQAIDREKPMFVLKTGDFVEDGWNWTDWVSYFTASQFLHNSTLYPELGNHEDYSVFYFSFFTIPGNQRWYSFDNGPVHFIGLNSNTPGRYRISQYLWLCHDLQRRDAPFTIVFFHHPLYSSSNHGNSTFLQKVWGPVFSQYHVDIVFTGHDHDYEHSLVKNVTYIVTGGGGSSLYDNGHSPWTVYSEKTYHYCLLTVNSSTLKFEAKKPDGVVFDSFFLTK